MAESRIALVTGANRGIGLEVCRQLARLKNYRVVLSARDGQKGTQAIAALANEEFEAQFLELDVTSPAAINHAFIWLQQHYGRLDVLINNAGVYLDEGDRLREVDDQVIRNTFNINIWGPLRLCRMAIPLMERNGYGRIVNVSSGMGAMSQMGSRTGSYKVSKLALNGLTQILADEVDRRRIKINAVCPGCAYGYGWPGRAHLCGESGQRDCLGGNAGRERAKRRLFPPQQTYQLVKQSKNTSTSPNPTERINHAHFADNIHPVFFIRHILPGANRTADHRLFGITAIYYGKR